MRINKFRDQQSNPSHKAKRKTKMVKLKRMLGNSWHHSGHKKEEVKAHKSQVADPESQARVSSVWSRGKRHNVLVLKDGCFVLRASRPGIGCCRVDDTRSTLLINSPTRVNTRAHLTGSRELRPFASIHSIVLRVRSRTYHTRRVHTFHSPDRPHLGWMIQANFLQHPYVMMPNPVYPEVP